jgi:hypothetical protein
MAEEREGYITREDLEATVEASHIDLLGKIGEAITGAKAWVEERLYYLRESIVKELMAWVFLVLNEGLRGLAEGLEEETR